MDDLVKQIADMLTDDPDVFNEGFGLSGKCKNCGNYVKVSDAFCDKCHSKKTQDSVESDGGWDN